MPRKIVKNKKPATTQARSLSVDVYNAVGKTVGKISLPKQVFAAKVNPVLMAQAVRVYLANHRAGTASTKTRGEVKGSTRKIYRQKGTGRARHGAKRAPLFVGGGIVFGPKPRDYSLKIPKKMKRKALVSALTSKFKDKAIKIITSFDKVTLKTKTMNQLFNRLGENKKSDKVLIVISQQNENLYRAMRNIPKLTIRPARQLATYEILSHNEIIFTRDSIESLGQIYGTN